MPGSVWEQGNDFDLHLPFFSNFLVSESEGEEVSFLR